MSGLEICKAFYEQHGAPMLHEKFPQLEGRLAAALVGSGSECFGFDDEISRDHDFEPGFCLFYPDDDPLFDRKTVFALERAYAKLPRSFLGLERPALSPVGGSRRGVLPIGDFYENRVGSRDGNLTDAQWLSVPEFYLFEATDGAVFRDDLGTFSAIRARLSYYPEDVRRKKLAGNLLLMAQAGQYNYPRCLAHGETGAAQLAAFEFVKSAMQTLFLLNRRYSPYYKWSFRALRALPRLSELGDTLEFLISSENIGALCETKADVIEDVARMVIDELMGQELTRAVCGDLEKHAYSVNDAVSDGALRNQHILAAVQ